MGIIKEIWVADIKETLHQGNEFIKAGTDHGIYTGNGVVHVPQSGAAPSVEKNRSTLPATIAQRTDTDLTYNLNEFTTDPILVKRFDEMQTSYAKRQSVLSQHLEVMNERIGNEVAHDWSPTGSTDLVLETTGAATAELPNATATGTRKLITKEDVARMALKLDRDNMPKSGRSLLLPAQMVYELLGVDALVRQDFGRSGDLLTGVVTKLFGFDIYMRPSVVTFNNTVTKKAVGAVAAATDCLGAIAFHRSAVAAATGAVNVFGNDERADYYGTILSALVEHGSSKLRTDNKGIVAIRQGYVAP